MADDEDAEHNVRVRKELDRVASTTPAPLTALTQGIAHTGRSLAQLLGAGSEAILPSDDAQMPAERLAAALLMWARRRLRRSSTRKELVKSAIAVSALTRKLRQRMASVPKPAVWPPASMPEQRLVIFAGTTRLRFRIRNFLWADGSPEPRLFDRVFPSTTSDKELLKARTPGRHKQLRSAGEGAELSTPELVRQLLAEKRKQPMTLVDPKATRRVDAFRLKPPILPNGTFIALKPPVSPLQATRGAIRSYEKEGRVGLHEKPAGLRTLAHLLDLRVKLRTVVQAMGASGDDDAGYEEEPVGFSDVLQGINHARCTEIGVPLQQAWGYAVSERLFTIWRSLNLSKDGLPYKYPSTKALERTGLEEVGVPNILVSSSSRGGGVSSEPYNVLFDDAGLMNVTACWCPPRPRSAARCPSRANLRRFLGLLLEQKRIHVDELNQGYQHWADVAKPPVEPPAADALPPVVGEQSLLKLHARLVLKALKYDVRANARWETLIEKQLAPEAEESVDAESVAASLRLARRKIVAFEDLLIEGLAEYSDARGALRMHLFNKDAGIPLSKQISNRLAGTMFGELLGQRFEQLELPEFYPVRLGASEALPNFVGEGGSGSGGGGGGGGKASSLPFVVPAAEAAEELALDNVLLGQWLGVLPAMLRNAIGLRPGAAVVGVPEVYDTVLEALLQGMIERAATGQPDTQLMLTFAAMSRYAWAAMRKGDYKQEEPPPAAAPPPPAATADAATTPAAANKEPPLFTAKQIANIRKALLPLVARVRAATPKGATPDMPAAISALRAECQTLENDALVLKDPIQADIDYMDTCLQALLNLLQGATRSLRKKRRAEKIAAGEAEAPTTKEELEEAVKVEEAARLRTAKAIKKLKTYIQEAFTQSYDVKQAADLGEPANTLSVVGEAVADVSVEQSDLIAGVYKLLYGRTLNAVITDPRIPAGASRRFLATVVKRKPVVIAKEKAATKWAMKKNDKGEVIGEVAKARAWAKKVVTGIEESRDGQRLLLEWITLLTLDELRAVQGALSMPPPGEAKILLPDLVNSGVGGVARLVLLAKLDKSMVPDSDDPLRLNKAFRLLPGRDGPPAAGGGAKGAKGQGSVLPLRYSEGEEYVVRGTAEATPIERQLLDCGQRLAPDGSQFNALRLHRIFAMQSAAADRAAKLTIERMLDEFVTLTFRPAFYEPTTPDEVTLRGRGEVLRFLINEGFSRLKAGGTDGKKKGEGCTFVQPGTLTADGQTRCVLCAGGQPECGSVGDRLRIGEQIRWSPWGAILSIVRVEKPLTTHYEWVNFFHYANFAGIKKLLDPSAKYYCLFHQYAPESANSKRFIATKYEGAEAVFARLDAEMARQNGNISAISSPLMGDKIHDLRTRRKAVLDAPSTLGLRWHKCAGIPTGGIELKNNLLTEALTKQLEFSRLEWTAMGLGSLIKAEHYVKIGDDYVQPVARLESTCGEPNPESLEVQGHIALAKEAYHLCLNYGGEGEGPKRSVLHFVGRWLPLGEGSARKGQLVCCVRETIGWKYNSKPPKPGPDGAVDDKPSASRQIGFLCREFFIGRRLREPQPHAHGLAPQWELHKQRVGDPNAGSGSPR